ncbi:MAG: PQQ-binding-like beta-propeller repeat protein [Lentisphaeraceae bacterium]|nr:PQQ-binding-like beta-propeller repeat protein [Lentisphaeraceae bacterium]
MRNKLFTTALALGLSFTATAEDWPQWGKTNDRNMISNSKNVPSSFNPGKWDDDKEDFTTEGRKNILWVHKLGSQTYGNPTVANGQVYVGTNNEVPHNPAIKGDRGIVLCLDEKTGKFKWQVSVPKMDSGKVNDWEYLGICSSPTVDGDRVYIMTNRCEIICVDAKGMENGNQGYQKEAEYINSVSGAKTNVKPGKLDADILWVYDMREELGVFPHNATSSAPLVIGDKVYCNTSNGVDWSHKNIPSPFSPAVICLDKMTGKLAGEEMSGISERILHGSWSTPAHAKTSKGDMVFYGAPDGFLYAFDSKPVENKEEELMQLKEAWKIDCNPKSYRFKDGKAIKYAKPEGPSEIISTPVIYDDKVYVPIGQDPEHGTGLGNFVCAEAATGKILWQTQKINRSISTPSITKDLIFVADFNGVLHCLDRHTGKTYWTHDTESHIWGSTLLVDGKVYIGNEDGELYIFEATKTKKELANIYLEASIFGSPVIANGVLYVATQTHLFAIKQ